MTKIRPVLLWLLFSGVLSSGPAMNAQNPAVLQPGSGVHYAVEQAVFTVHRLTGLVEPEKKQPFARLTKGHPVSRPCPTPPQQPQRPC